MARELRRVPAAGDDPPPDGGREPLEVLLASVARGDLRAFEQLYEAVAGRVFGVVLAVLRDRAMSEEVTQEVFVEVWRGAARYHAPSGSAAGWILTVAHHRAVDRVRAEQAARDREQRQATREHRPAYDDVVEQVERRLEVEQVRRCLGSLTGLQRESVELAYYGGYTYPEVARLLTVPLGTVKTRLRDGLIRLRDCLGVA